MTNRQDTSILRAMSFGAGGQIARVFFIGAAIRGPAETGPRVEEAGV